MKQPSGRYRAPRQWAAACHEAWGTARGRSGLGWEYAKDEYGGTGPWRWLGCAWTAGPCAGLSDQDLFRASIRRRGSTANEVSSVQSEPAGIARHRPFCSPYRLCNSRDSRSRPHNHPLQLLSPTAPTSLCAPRAYGKSCHPVWLESRCWGTPYKCPGARYRQRRRRNVSSIPWLYAWDAADQFVVVVDAAHPTASGSALAYGRVAVPSALLHCEGLEPLHHARRGLDIKHASGLLCVSQ